MYEYIARVQVLVVRYQVSGCSMDNMQRMSICVGVRVYLVCISCEVSGMLMLHVPHARYDYMGRV